MRWDQLKAQLQGGHFNMALAGAFGQKKTVTLTMAGGALTFSTLGTGTMKRVVRVVGENWVLAIAGDSPGAPRDIQDEAATLCALGSGNVRVPEPFRTARVDEIVFDLLVYSEDRGEDVRYPCFIQQFLPYQEMDKLQPREGFASSKILVGGKPPATIQTTVDDLERIVEYFGRKGEWGDFQVMYDRASGAVYVFDPLPPPNRSHVNYTNLVNRWLQDIENARAAERRRMAVRPARSKSF